MTLIKVKKVSTGAGPLLLDDRDPRIGSVFVPWVGPVPAPSAPPAATTAPSAVGSGGQASEPPATASDRREPTRDEVAAYLAHRDQGLSHKEACLAVWPDMDPPDEPAAEELARIKARLTGSAPAASLGTDASPASEGLAGATPKGPRAPRGGKTKGKGNDISAYDAPVNAAKG